MHRWFGMVGEQVELTSSIPTETSPMDKIQARQEEMSKSGSDCNAFECQAKGLDFLCTLVYVLTQWKALDFIYMLVCAHTMEGSELYMYA